MSLPILNHPLNINLGLEKLANPNEFRPNGSDFTFVARDDDRFLSW